MTDNDLANRVVALGLAEGPNNYMAYALLSGVMDWMPADTFTSDPRVAMALLTKMSRLDLIHAFVGGTESPKWHYLDRLRDSREVVESCVCALESE